MTGVSSDLRAGSQTRAQVIAVVSVTQLCARGSPPLASPKPQHAVEHSYFKA